MSTMEELSQEYFSSKEKEKRKKLTGKMDKLEAEFSEVHEMAQEYLDSGKEELSSLVTDASENTRRCRIEESVERKSVEKQALEERTRYRSSKRRFRRITSSVPRSFI